MADEDENEISIGAQAFAIVADQIRSEVSSENTALLEENSRLEPTRAHLGSVEIRVGSGFLDGGDRIIDGGCRIIPLSSGLGDATLEGSDRLLVVKIPVSEDDEATLPLAEYGVDGEASLFISKQLVAMFPSKVSPVVKEIHDVGSLSVALPDATGKVLFHGKVDNLSNEDFERIRNEVGGEGYDRESGIFTNYMNNGFGMNSPDATFTPEFIIALPGRLLNATCKGILVNTLLAQRYNWNQLERKLQLMQGERIELEVILESLKAKFSILESIKADLSEIEVGVMGEVEENIKATENVVEEQKRTYDEILACSQLKQRKQQFVEMIPEYTNYFKSPEDVLRDLVSTVDSNPESREILNYNRTLKLERHLLLQIQSRIGQIEMFYDRGYSVDFSEDNEVCRRVWLDSGFEVKDENGRCISWQVPLPRIVVNTTVLHSFDVYMSGVSLTNNGSTNAVLRMANDNDPSSITICLVCRSGLTLLGYFQFDTWESLEETLANELFIRVVEKLFNGKRSEARLPDDCSFVPESIFFRFGLIEDTLKVLGCLPSDSIGADNNNTA
jgi:hypothetical protein